MGSALAVTAASADLFFPQFFLMFLAVDTPSTPPIQPIQLTLTRHQQPNGLRYQRLEIALTSGDRLIEPQDLTQIAFPTGIDTSLGVVISGRGPIWLYAYLIHELHPTPWIACYDPRFLGAVVVATHSRQTCIGEVIPVELPEKGAIGSAHLCPGLMVVGPPDSGKSVLSHALFEALKVKYDDIYLQRAQWDGEGNYLLDRSPLTPDDREYFKALNRGGLTDGFFVECARGILNLRRQKRLVIVDVGGMVQPEKEPLAQACSHYLIISSKPEEVEPWHGFCRDRGGLKPLAVLHSTLDDCEVVHRDRPWLEMTCGPWVQGKARAIPEALLACLQGAIAL